LGNLENCTPAVTILWGGAGAGSLVRAAQLWKLIVFIGGIRKAGFRRQASGKTDAARLSRATMALLKPEA
jgi:hypothetical protein